jgi:hypothetical protein
MALLPCNLIDDLTASSTEIHRRTLIGTNKESNDLEDHCAHTGRADSRIGAVFHRETVRRQGKMKAIPMFNMLIPQSLMNALLMFAAEMSSPY